MDSEGHLGASAGLHASGIEFPLTSSTVRSVDQSCLTLCDPMDCSTPGFPVHHQLPELPQTRVHRVGKCHPSISSSVIPLFCLQSFPASGSFPVSQFFAKVSSWPKYWSFSFNISPSNEHPGLISLGWTGWISLQSKGSQESSPTPQFKKIYSSVLSFLCGPVLTSIHD